MADQVAGAALRHVALRHVALLHRKRAEYLSTVTEFLGTACDRGEPVLAAVPGERIGELRRALGGRARVSFLDMTELGRNPATIIPAIRAFTDRHAGQRVSYLGEPAWPGRTAAELVEAARHEALINIAFAATPISILCPYDAALPASARADARCTHPEIIEGGTARASGDYLGPHGLPPRCERPLADPPTGADRLSYQSDLRPLRALVAARAIGYGLSETRASDLVLAVSEIAANTLRHTSGGGTLSVWTAAGEILCEVRDSGWIEDPLAGRTKPPEHPTGRQGLWVVNKICDLVELRSSRSGTSIRLHMSLARDIRGGQSRWAAALPALMSPSPAAPQQQPG
jgi:anti-sigma regulatory factor (Ser/Thr protein kinase)